MPLLGAIEAPPAEFSSLAELFDKTYKHEKHITSEINKLAHVAMTTQDYSTFNFFHSIY